MNPYITLTDNVIALRPYEFGEENELHRAIQESLADLKPWMAWATENYTQETALNYIAHTRADFSDGRSYEFAVKDAATGEYLGGCGLNHIHPVYYFSNLGYWTRSSKRGRGIAARAARLIAKFAFEQVGLIRAEIVIATGNEASKRVAEKIPAHYEGILLNRMTIGKRITDAHMFSLLPSDFGLVARI